MKTTINTKNRNIEKLKSEIAKSTSPNVRNKLQANLNKALKNQISLNGQKRALQEQLNNAMKNRANVNNRLRKSEAEKMQYMREMNTLAGNVRNITKQKENANAEIQSLKNRLVNQNLTIKQRNALQKLVEKKKQEKNELTNKIKELEDNRNFMEKEHRKMFDAKQEEITKIRAERESLRFNATRAARERNNLKQKRSRNIENMNRMREQLGNLKVESNERQRALNEAAAKEAEITKKLGESNKSIQNLTTQRDELLEQGKLNAAQKEELEEIRNKLKVERNAKKNEINRLQTLSKNRERALKEISTKLNVATRELTRSKGLIGTQEVHLKDQNAKLKERQNQVGKLYGEQEGLKKLIETLKTQATQANEQIRQQTTKLATSANEIKRLQGQLTNATEARERNIRNMQMRHAENIRAATDQIQALTKNVQERNAIIQRSKVAGRWKGLALGAQLRNTRTNLNRAQKEIGIARDVVTGLRGQRNALGTQLRNTQSNLQKALTNVGAKQFQIEGQQSTIGALQARNKVSRGVISGLQGQRKNLQKSKAASAWKGATRALRANRRLRNAKGEAMRLGTQLKEKNEQIKFEQNWIGKAEKRALNAREAVRVSGANRMKERIAAQREIKGLRTTLENRDRKNREQFNATKAFYQLNNLNAAKRNLTNEIGKNLPRYFLNGLERIRLENRVKAAENMRNIGRIRNDLKRTVGMRMKKAGKQGTFGRGFAGSDHSAGRNYALHTRSRMA